MSNWGNCRHCQSWQIEPEQVVQTLTIGRCNDDYLKKHTLTVTADCGCSRFVEGQPQSLTGEGRPVKSTAIGGALLAHTDPELPIETKNSDFRAT